MSTNSDQDHFSPFTGRLSITSEEMAEQRRAGWPDMHPEDFCHRCFGRNLSWWCDPDVWNAVMRPEGPDSPWRWNEIICPACFAELFIAKFGRASLTFTVDENTIGGKKFAAENALVTDERTKK